MEINRLLNSRHIENIDGRLSFDFMRYFQRSMDIFYNNVADDFKPNVIEYERCWGLAELAENLSLYLKLRFKVAEHPIFFTFCNDDFLFDAFIHEKELQKAKRSLIDIGLTAFYGIDFLASISWKVTDDNKFKPVIRGFCFSQLSASEIGNIQKRSPNGIFNFYEAADLINAVLLTFAGSLDVSQFWSFFEDKLCEYACFQPRSAGCFGHKAVLDFVKKNF